MTYLIVAAKSNIADRIDDYISKYMEVLDIKGPPPKSRLIDSPRADWLARAKWNLAEPRKTVLEFHSELFKHDKNDNWLERSIAHEMIHYRDVLARSEGRKASHDPSQHGPSFQKGAARINATMGPDFVTDEVVKLPTGTLLSTKDLEAAKAPLQKKLVVALGIAGFALLGIALAQRTRPSMPNNERGNYSRR